MTEEDTHSDLVGTDRHFQDIEGYIALIDRRVLERECLAHSLNSHRIRRRVLTFPHLQAWKDTKDQAGMPAAVLFNTGNCPKAEIATEVADVVAEMAPAAVVVLSDDQDINSVLDLIGLGVRGYIPSSVNIDICSQAISLAIAGGRFIPASSLMSRREVFGLTLEKPLPRLKLTKRQSAIAEALRCGKANKDIASELRLCESTIKVHIRNIMRKLGATNRTEVACRMGDMVCEH